MGHHCLTHSPVLCEPQRPHTVQLKRLISDCFKNYDKHLSLLNIRLPGLDSKITFLVYASVVFSLSFYLYFALSYQVGFPVFLECFIKYLVRLGNKSGIRLLERSCVLTHNSAITTSVIIYLEKLTINSFQSSIRIL